MPYTLELNDINLFVFNSFTGPEFEQMVIDQFEQLYADSAESGRVMSLALHPFVIGQAFRAGYLARALEHIISRPGVWLTTSDEIAEVYAAQFATSLEVAA